MEKNKIGFFKRATLTRLLLLLTLGMASTQLCAQTRNVRMPSREFTVEQAIEQIESQAGLIIGVNHKRFDVSRTIRTDSESLPVNGLLDRIIAGTGHSYIASGKHVVIVTDNKPKAQFVQAEHDEPIIIYEPITVEEIVAAYDVPEEVEPQITEYTTVNGGISEKTFSFSSYDPQEFTAQDKKQPSFAVKTNLGYGLATLTPNIGIEFGMGKKTTLEIMGGWNPWNRKGSADDNKKHVHSYIQPEFRWWTCERFNGHFFGIHALGSHYNVSGYDLPFLKFDKEYRYEGYALGAGISYGYAAMLSPVVGLEFSIGAGLIWLDYDRYSCEKCAREKEGFTKTRFAPTKAAISLVFIIK